MKYIAAILLTFGLFSTLFASEPKKLSNGKYSLVELSKTKEKDGTHVTFGVKIADGIKYNWDGPWKLKLTGENLKKTYGTSDFNKEKGGYLVTVPADVKKFDYRLTTFICTKDKKRCFREVHKSSIEI